MVGWLRGRKRRLAKPLDVKTSRGFESHPDRMDDPLKGANCHFCGGTADNFRVADSLWAKVEPTLGQNQTCFKCFRIAAWDVGLREVWNVTQSVTSVDHDSDDPKNVGTKPEVFTDGYFRLAEDPLKDGF